MYSVYRLNGNLYCAVSVQGMEGVREVPVAKVQNKEIFKEFIKFSGGVIPHFQYSTQFEVLEFNKFVHL